MYLESTVGLIALVLCIIHAVGNNVEFLVDSTSFSTYPEQQTCTSPHIIAIDAHNLIIVNE